MEEASSRIRSWRTTFLTLRDEALTSPESAGTLIRLLNHLIFTHSHTLIAAAPDLPPPEVTSDALFLVELAGTICSDSDSHSGADDHNKVQALTQLSYLIQNFTCHVAFQMTSSSWTLVLHTYQGMIEIFLGIALKSRLSSENIAVVEATQNCLQTIRYIVKVHPRMSLSDNMQLLKFLLNVVSFSQAASPSCYSYFNQGRTSESAKVVTICNNFWESQIVSFTMISEVFLVVGTSLPVDHWQATVDVLRKVMDVLTSKGLLMEGNIMDKFYTSLLHCLHQVLINAKGSISAHVPGFVAALRMFFNYGLTGKAQIASSAVGYKKDISVTFPNSRTDESNKGAYRPPHLRKKEQQEVQSKDTKSLRNLGHKSGRIDPVSSDSDLSDSDGSVKEDCNVRSSKARLAAIICIQDLCRADPKSFTAQWTMLLPSSDVLQVSRRYEANLMTCLLFDPYLKARIASASTLTTMLEGPASVFLQVAEYKESTKCGSFMALSSSLGQILMQLHMGILYLLNHEKRSGLLTPSFKILLLLISSTPYSRMPSDLLSTIISSLQGMIAGGLLFHRDQGGLMAVAISCLTAALSVSPSSPKVKDLFLAELTKGFVEDKANTGVLSILFRYCQPVTSPTICIEALQALKAVAHNYPDVVVDCWKQISSMISGFLKCSLPESSVMMVNSGYPVGAIGEKVIAAAIKLLDECLRAMSGFNGTEDLSDDKLLDSPFTSDYIKIKAISSAPSYGLDSHSVTYNERPVCLLAGEHWCEAIEKQLASTLLHSSAMVRSASITCFAGITSPVFFCLPKDKQECIVTYSINAAVDDEVPSVRSAACRAIGVIACFPQVLKSAAVLGKFIHAAEVNSRHQLVSVRITASWALANICDSLRLCDNGFTSGKCCEDFNDCSQFVSLLIECSLRLTKDGDKVKANAVRALGNLSRFVPCPSQHVHQELDQEVGCDLETKHSAGKSAATHASCNNKWNHVSISFLPSTLKDSHWLEGMVQAFISCVTTGNVKVRWNVCHALSNLFLNETIKLQYMEWAPSVFSILLLLLRDSSNFKIRIQAAAALAVPSKRLDYGKSYSDVVQGIEHVLENLGLDQISDPSSFRYRVALEKQLTSTMLHVLGLASITDHESVHGFLVKKASFFEEWLGKLCSSLGDSSIQLDAEHDSTRKQKKEVISRAIGSVVRVYEVSNHHALARRFEKLLIRLS